MGGVTNTAGNAGKPSSAFVRPGLTFDHYRCFPCLLFYLTSIIPTIRCLTSPPTVGGLGNVLGDTVKGTTGTLSDTTKGVGNVAKDTTGGVGDTARDTTGAKQNAQNPLGLSE